MFLFFFIVYFLFLVFFCCCWLRLFKKQKQNKAKQNTRFVLPVILSFSLLVLVNIPVFHTLYLLFRNKFIGLYFFSTCFHLRSRTLANNLWPPNPPTHLLRRHCSAASRCRQSSRPMSQAEMAASQFSWCIHSALWISLGVRFIVSHCPDQGQSEKQCRTAGSEWKTARLRGVESWSRQGMYWLVWIDN